jgi:hypothetical protein
MTHSSASISPKASSRELGLLYDVQASPATLGEALGRVARYSSVAHQGLAANCVRGNALTFRIDYVGVRLSSLMVARSEQPTTPVRPPEGVALIGVVPPVCRGRLCGSLVGDRRRR